MKQFIAVFIGAFVAVCFFAVMLKIRGRKSACKCGQGHCQTGGSCETHELGEYHDR